MAEPYTYTFGDIRLRVMKQLRLPPNNLDVQDQIMTSINEVYKDIAAKQDWWWLLKHGVLKTQTVYGPGQEGSVDVSTSATVKIIDDAVPFFLFLGTIPEIEDFTNWVVIVPGLSTDPSAVFRITGPQGTINNAWNFDLFTGETASLYDSAGISVNIYQDSIPLPTDVNKLLQVRRYGRTIPMQRVGIEEMMQIKEYDRSEGMPELYSIYDSVFTGLSGIGGNRMLQIHPYPNHQYRLDIYYKEALTTNLDVGTIPLIPSDYQQTLIYGALSRGYPIFLNDTERGAYYLSLFNDLMALMSAQQKEYAKDQSGIRPDMMGYQRTTTRTRPRTSYTLGRRFDTLPNIP